MAKRKKPTRLKIIAGNPGKRKLPKEPAPKPSNLDQPPTWMRGRAARRKWRELAPMLQEWGIMAETDVDALALLCTQYQIYEEALKIVQVEGFTTTSSKGTETKHPAMRVLEGAQDRVLSMLREFGMTPASRSNVSVVAGYGQGSSDWDDFD